MNLQKYKIVLPNMVTSVSILAGLFAIFFTFEEPVAQNGGFYTFSCWLIIFAAIVDGLDGKVARLTHSSSEFGIQYDSIADVITFGVAATIVIFRQIFFNLIDDNRIFYLIPIFFLLCGAVRLARFNCSATTKAKSGFTGLPIPVAACALVSLILFFEGWDCFLVPKFGLTGLPEEIKTRMMIGSVLLVSVLMVSQVKYDVTYMFLFNDIKKHPIRTTVLLLILGLTFWHPGLGFYVLSSFYILFGLVRAVFGTGPDNDDANGVPSV
ncbi:MAG: CDP-diacylglycerol--serine O-phosphatidyltransferase [Fibrobacterota bacterium]